VELSLPVWHGSERAKLSRQYDVLSNSANFGAAVQSRSGGRNEVCKNGAICVSERIQLRLRRRRWIARLSVLHELRNNLMPLNKFISGALSDAHAYFTVVIGGNSVVVLLCNTAGEVALGQ
jgi:hypothetical protein